MHNYILFSFFIYFNLIAPVFPIQISNKYNNLISWIEENGGFVSKKIHPNETSLYNRVMKSNSSISKGELLSFIPEKIVLSSIHPLLNEVCRNAYGLYHKLDLECITLFISYDKYNKSSFFRPYYDYLPKLDIKIFPSEYEKEKLDLYEELEFDLYVGISNNKLKNGFNEDVEKILEKKGIKNPFEEFKYNYYLVKSRNFARPGSEFFFDLNSCVPFIELFNHDIEFNTDWGFDSDKKGFYLKAVKDIKIGEELTTTYGEQNNINLFMDYGFTLSYNKFKNPIRIKIGEFRYTFYPSNNEEKNIKEVLNAIKSLKEIFGFEKKKDKFIYNLLIKTLEEKIEKIMLIEKSDINIINIIEEITISLKEYIKILNDLIYQLDNI